MVSLPISNKTHHAFISHGDVLVQKRDEKGVRQRAEEEKTRGGERDSYL